MKLSQGDVLENFFDLASFAAISSIGLAATDDNKKYNLAEAILFIFLVRYKGVYSVRMKVARFLGYAYISLLVYSAVAFT